MNETYGPNCIRFPAQVPFDPVDLEINEKTQGLVSPEPFQLPAISPLWTPVAYAAFDESKTTGKVILCTCKQEERGNFDEFRQKKKSFRS
jgi:hypothetical protein